MSAAAEKGIQVQKCLDIRPRVTCHTLNLSGLSLTVLCTGLFCPSSLYHLSLSLRSKTTLRPTTASIHCQRHLSTYTKPFITQSTTDRQMGLGPLFLVKRFTKPDPNSIEQAATMSQQWSEKAGHQTTIDEVHRPRSTYQTRLRPSWLDGRPETEDQLQALPPMSAHTAPRRSARRSSHSKRHSFWNSSNPDQSDEDVPSVPSLSRGTSLDSVSAQDDRQASTSTVAPRRKYVPKSAAKSFLVTTSGASEDNRKSYRKSLKLDDGADLVCMTEEQQIEWAKLMNARAEMQALERVDSRVDSKPKYANEQALAALEFR